MRIAYFANADSAHDCNWINYFASDPENHVILFCGSQQETKYLDSHVKVYPIIPAYSYFNFILRCSTLKKIRNVLLNNNIEMVHSLYGISTCFWAYHLRFSPHIITTRGSDILEDYSTNYRKPANLFRKISFRHAIRTIERSYNHAAAVISTSISQQVIIKTFLKDQKKMFLIRTGVDISKLLSQLQLKERTDKTFTIFSTRFIQPLYNIDIIVKAAAICKDKFQQFKFKVINNFPGTSYSKQILDLIHELQIENYCEVLPAQTWEGMAGQYNNSDIVVMLPNSDGTPVSAIEAMVAKVPVIIGDFNYDQDIFNTSTVWKLSKNDPQTLADKIIEIYNTDKNNILSKTDIAFKTAGLLADREKEMNRLKKIYESVYLKK